MGTEARARGTRRVLVTAVTTTLLLTGVPSPARAAGGYEIAFWRMNEAPGSTRMVDSSGNGLHGRIGDEVGTGLSLGDDIGYRFERLEPDTPPARPGHLVVVPDRGPLNPGTRDFAVTLRLRTTHKFGNIVQKGQAATSGGNFKLQIPSGRVECAYRGSAGTIEVFAPYAINDGRWHVVRCTRTGRGVTLSIDGRTVAGKRGWTGRIANSWPLSIGGKTDCDQRHVGCDYYAGDLDYVLVEAADTDW